MIISASRRTDLPAFYSGWFFNRLKEGFVLVRNPGNPHRLSRIGLSPSKIDGIVFWTKNPLPMLDRLSELKGFNFYFQFTLNAYGPDAEPGLPSKNDVLIPAFQRLSSLVGKERVIWRYDPIFLSKTYSIGYHARSFELLAKRLHRYTQTCTVSFLDRYLNTERNTRPLGIRPETPDEQMEIMRRFSEIAFGYGLTLNTCAEQGDFRSLGAGRAKCIDKERLEMLGGVQLDVGKAAGQRPACGCAESFDIGAYHSCPNGCLYCYANANQTAAFQNMRRHNPAAPVLLGDIGPDDCILERKTISHQTGQTSLF